MHPWPEVQAVTAKRSEKPSINQQHDAGLGLMEWLAVWIADHSGTTGFFVIILVWTVVWMGWTLLAQDCHWPGVFDQPWQFLIWLFVSNLIQIHVMPLIMVGQNLQARHAELRA